MDNLKEILDSLNPKAPTKKKIKMKDVFSNSKTPNKIITMMTGYKY
jgi:hypothetical protein